MRRFIPMLCLLMALATALVSCTKKQLTTDPPYQYELTFGFEADEQVSNFIIESSEDGQSWHEATAILPDAIRTEYTIPLPDRPKHTWYRIKATTQTGIYYSNIYRRE